MNSRLTFLALTAFWITMNVLLWQMEYGSQGGDMPVPVQLVWRKILTAPDASSLSVYEKGDRTGYCELSTSVGQQMAAMDDSKPPPEGYSVRSGYQLHFAGNISLGDFTNRLKFDGHISFSPQRAWEDLIVKISAHQATVEIHANATNPLVKVRITAETGTLERDIPIRSLGNPNALIQAFAGNLADTLLGALELPDFTPAAESQNMEWTARRTRLKVGAEYVPVYRLETSVLGHEVSVDVSTLGEILRIRLPDHVTAVIDELSHP